MLCNEVGDNSCDVSAYVIMLKCDVTSMNLQEREYVKMENFIMVPNTCQIAVNDLQLVSVMCVDDPMPSCFHRRMASIAQHMCQCDVPLSINKHDNSQDYCQNGTSTLL